ncbi:MAG: CotH kinase family protein, partial [Oscillospiraceae bacterium]|nr:CotH kinase family protein [Oscillospiraceae bacterium]
TGVATVNYGAITAVSAGTATITITTHNGHSTTVAVTVEVPADAPVIVVPTGISPSTTSVSLTGVGASVSVIANVIPANAANRTVTWTSNNPRVATVNNGAITAVSAGTAIISARTHNGISVNITVTVTVPTNVTAVILPTGITVSQNNLTLTTATSHTVTANITPQNAANRAVTWTSSNNAVASVINGRITAVAPGSATITASTHNGITARVTVTVNASPPQENFATLPVVRVNNTIGAPIRQSPLDRHNHNTSFNRTDWINVSVTVSNAPANSILNNVQARFRGRGNSSWMASKRSFRLRFDNGNVTMPFADHSARDWTFIANHRDKSLMRNYSAYHLASMLDGLNVSPYAQFAHVYFNGVYQGVYMISIHVPEPVHHGTGRVQTTRNPNPALSEFIIEYQLRYRLLPRTHMGERLNEDLIEGEDWFTLHGNRSYRIRYGGTTPAHNQYVESFIWRVDNAIMGRNMATLRNIVCIDSFVDFYVMQELFRDADTARASIFMQIIGTGANRRLVMGPVWDFDHAAGGSVLLLPSHPYHVFVTNGTPVDTQGTSLNPRPGTYYCPWFRSLMLIPEFRAMVSARFIQVRDQFLPQTTAHLLGLRNQFSACFNRNFSHWNITPSQNWACNPPVISWNIHNSIGHRGQVEWLSGWLTIRAAYLAGYYNNQSPYFAPVSHTSAMTVNRGATANIFNIDLRAGSLPSHIRSLGFNSYRIVRVNANGSETQVRSGNISPIGGRITFSQANAQNTSTYRLIVYYTVDYRFSAHCPGYIIRLNQPFDVALTVN